MRGPAMNASTPNHQPTAMCLTHTETSSLHAARHTEEVQRHASKLGYFPVYTVSPPADDPDPLGYALDLASDLGVDALVVHDLATVGNTPSRVCDKFDLVTVSPPATWTAVLPGTVDPLHTHPDRALTVVSAQRIMQGHRDCRACTCPRKSSAYSFLVREAKIIPPVDTPRERAAARGIPFRPRPDSDAPLPEGVNLETLLDILAGLAEYSPVGKQ